MVNCVLKKFELNEENFTYIKNELMNIIDKCETSPDIVKKALKIQNTTPYCTYRNIDILEGYNRISDEMFDYYLKLEKTHPQCCSPTTLGDINYFLSTQGTDEKLLKEIFEKSIKTGNYLAFNKIAFLTNENNIGFLKQCLENDTLDAEALFKLKMLGLNPSCKDQLDNICEEIFRPLFKVFQKYSQRPKNCDFWISEIVQMKLKNPEKFKKLQDSKILDLVKEEKIHPRILVGFTETADFTPEILSDVKKLLNGESLIKKFDTTKDIIKNTLPGDVASVNGKLYINNNGKLEPWSMTEEKFNELFPLVDRFSTLQGRDDCYFVSVLNSLYYNPKTRGSYYKMFEQNGNDIFVTIPAYRNYGGAIKFPNGEIQLHEYSADAAKNVQMLERAFSKVSLRKDRSIKIPNSEDPLISNDLDYLSRRIFGGHPTEVLEDFLADLKVEGRCVIQQITNKTKIKDFLDKFGQNPKYIINEAYITGANRGHAVSIKEYDPKSETITVIDPNQSGTQEKFSLGTILKDIFSITVTRLM